MENRRLYLLVLAGLASLVVMAAGSGLWNRPADYASWQYRMFQGICHQLPDRSFHIQGEPMAVNTRCFGIFSGLLTGWMLFPFLPAGIASFRWSMLLWMMVLFQLADWTAGQLSVWNSSDFSRFFSGSGLGVAVAFVVVTRFYPDLYSGRAVTQPFQDHDQ